MKTPRGFFKPLAIGAPTPYRELPARVERMIHFVPPHLEKVRAKVAEIAPTVEAAVAGASLICTVTGAAEPILAGRMISAGAHVNVVGSSVAAAREIDVDAVEKARFFVDYKPSTLLQGGEFLAAKREGRVGDDHILAEIGEILTGSKTGRRTDDEITIYKSLGIPAEDLVCAHYLYTAAAERGLGASVAFS